MEKITTNRARQGTSGLQVLMVLVIAMALAGVVWFGLEFWGETIDSESTGQPGAVQTAPQPASPDSSTTLDSTP